MDGLRGEAGLERGLDRLFFPIEALEGGVTSAGVDTMEGGRVIVSTLLAGLTGIPERVVAAAGKPAVVDGRVRLAAVLELVVLDVLLRRGMFESAIAVVGAEAVAVVAAATVLAAALLAAGATAEAVVVDVDVALGRTGRVTLLTLRSL